MTGLAPAADASAADWLVESLTTFAESVLSLVPAGFETYVRVFHPAQRGGRPLRWAEIATECARVAHPGMQLCALVGEVRVEDSPAGEFFDLPPAEGYLPQEVVPPLVEALGRHTRAPERGWFAVWEGFAMLLPHARAAVTFTLPNRRYHLLAGPVAAAGESFLDRRAYEQTANLWWPDDRAWCVATEIDLKSTYVACSRACADDLLAQDELEVLEIDPATGIAWDSDAINPKPAGLL